MLKPPLALGLRYNWKQFALLVLVNALVGAMVGLERTVVPLLAEADFGIVSKSVVLSFIVSFGVVKALTNLFAGRLADRIGRRRILIAGWLIGLPVPLLIMAAPAWGWIIFANVLLGINQGLCWSMTVNMKIDLAGPQRRGLALGLNESAGYVAVALSALLTGTLAANYGLRPVPFYAGVAFSVLGLFLSVFAVRDTQGHVRQEAALRQTEAGKPLTWRQIFLLTSWKDRALFATSQAGLVNNLNDGVVWGLVPILLASSSLPLEQIAIVVAIYPIVWGLGQLVTGALSDRWGRKWLISAGMGIQAIGIGLFAAGHDFVAWASAAALLGVGTALVYPTLLAVVSDVAQPEWRSSAIGVYRLWRDLGYALGALLGGWLADATGMPFALGAIGGLTLLSGLVAAGTLVETLPAHRALTSSQMSTVKGQSG